MFFHFRLIKLSDLLSFGPQLGEHKSFMTPRRRCYIPNIPEMKSDLPFCPPPQCFLWPSVTNSMMLYSTLRCKKIARAPGGHKKFMLTKLEGRNIIYKKLEGRKIVYPISYKKVQILEWEVAY